MWFRSGGVQGHRVLLARCRVSPGFACRLVALVCFFLVSRWRRSSGRTRPRARRPLCNPGDRTGKGQERNSHLHGEQRSRPAAPRRGKRNGRLSRSRGFLADGVPTISSMSRRPLPPRVPIPLSTSSDRAVWSLEHDGGKRPHDRARE